MGRGTLPGKRVTSLSVRDDRSRHPAQRGIAMAGAADANPCTGIERGLVIAALAKDIGRHIGCFAHIRGKRASAADGDEAPDENSADQVSHRVFLPSPVDIVDFNGSDLLIPSPPAL